MGHWSVVTASSDPRSAQVIKTPPCVRSCKRGRWLWHMNKLLVVLIMTIHPQIALAKVDPTISSGNFAHTKPHLMSVSYSKSSEDNAWFGLGITNNEPNKDQNGLGIPSAMIINGKTGIFSAALYFETEGGDRGSEANCRIFLLHA